MQDEMNEKIIGISLRISKDAAKLTEETVKEAMRQFLTMQEQEQPQKADKEKHSHGKQTIGKLMEQNQGISNIEITDGNIKSFERVARKYNIDFALQKDKAEDPPRYLVFFKARDVDVMTAAFKEYTAKEMTEEKKPSLKKLLSNALEIAAKHKERTKEKEKDRGQSL